MAPLRLGFCAETKWQFLLNLNHSCKTFSLQALTGSFLVTEASSHSAQKNGNKTGDNMKLWVTPEGDRWLCDECRKQYEKVIEEEKWRVAFEKWEPMLRCSDCHHTDMEIMD